MKQFNNVIFLTGSNTSITKDKSGVSITQGDGESVAITPVTGGDVTSETGTSTGTQNQVTDTAQEPQGFFGTMSPMTVLLFYVVIIAAAYYISIRPHKKREKAASEMRSSLGVGDYIVTTSGLYGKIVDIGGDVFVVEFGTNKGIKIPVAKKDIVAKKEPDFTISK